MNFNELIRRLNPDRSFFTFASLREMNQNEILYLLFTTPAFVELFARLDRLGHCTKPLGYPLSTTVRWLIGMAVTREHMYSLFYERMRPDSGLAALVAGPGQPLPQPSWLSDALRSHGPNLQTALALFYREMVRLFIRADPDLKYGLVLDAEDIHGYSNPSRPVMKHDPDSGRLVATKERKAATDPTAHYFVKREHRASRRPHPPAAKLASSKIKPESMRGETVRGGFGHRLSLLCFIKKPLFPIFDLYAPKGEGMGEMPVGRRLLEQLYRDFPELAIPEGEFGIFVGDSIHDAKSFHSFLRTHRLEGVIPVQTDPKRRLKGSPIIRTRDVNLTYRGDYTPLCSYEVEVESHGKKATKEINLPLRVLPSELGKYPAQVFSCPMSRPGECPSPCALEVRRDARGRVDYPPVKLRVGKLTDGELIRQRPLFPRRGDQHKQLFAYRSSVERAFSLLRTYCFGCEGEARLPIRGVENLQLRLTVIALVIGALAMLDDGFELDASIASCWGLPGNGLPFADAA